MAVNLRTLVNCQYIRNITKQVRWSIERNYSIRVLSGGVCYKNRSHQDFQVKPISLLPVGLIRQCSTQGNGQKPEEKVEPPKKGMVQKLKEMYRDYWYVVLPVHLATSAIWFGGFYYAVRSGVDVVAMLQSIGISETLLAPLKNSETGYLALTFALYKLASPLRYTVTIGGTTYAIKKLTAIGLIKPVPSRDRIKEIIQERKDTIQDRFNESRNHYHSQMSHIKEKRSHMMEEMRRYRTEIKNMKNKVKKM